MAAVRELKLKRCCHPPLNETASGIQDNGTLRPNHSAPVLPETRRRLTSIYTVTGNISKYTCTTVDCFELFQLFWHVSSVNLFREAYFWSTEPYQQQLLGILSSSQKGSGGCLNEALPFCCALNMQDSRRNQSWRPWCKC